MNYDGAERRKVDKDWIERDRLLSKMDSKLDHIVKWSNEHTIDDNKRFELVTKEIEVGKRILWGSIGVLIAFEFLMKVMK